MKGHFLLIPLFSAAVWPSHGYIMSAADNTCFINKRVRIQRYKESKFFLFKLHTQPKMQRRKVSEYVYCLSRLSHFRFISCICGFHHLPAPLGDDPWPLVYSFQ